MYKSGREECDCVRPLLLSRRYRAMYEEEAMQRLLGSSGTRAQEVEDLVVRDARRCDQVELENPTQSGMDERTDTAIPKKEQASDINAEAVDGVREMDSCARKGQASGVQDRR